MFAEYEGTLTKYIHYFKIVSWMKMGDKAFKSTKEGIANSSK
jgi:hypothetical protein